MKDLVKPVIVSPDAGGVARAKLFMEGFGRLPDLGIQGQTLTNSAMRSLLIGGGQPATTMRYLVILPAACCLAYLPDDVS